MAMVKRFRDDGIYFLLMIYLQFGDSVGSGLVPFGFIVLVVAAVLTYWVYNDATGRGKNKALFWALGVGILTLLTLIGGLIAFGIYLYTRD